MSKVNEWKEGIGHAWESLAEGWRDLNQRAAGALTKFRPGAPGSRDCGDEEMPRITSWGFLAADVFDDDDRIVVRLEAPGMRKDDFHIALHDDVLVIKGEKRFERENTEVRWRVLQCAYGSFRRAIPLPCPVKNEEARASYKNGVLRIELPKRAISKPQGYRVKVE